MGKILRFKCAAELILPESDQFHIAAENLPCLVSKRQTNMPFGRITRRRQRQHILLKIQYDRSQKCINAFHHRPVAALHGFSQVIQEYLTRSFDRAGRKPRSHVIGNPRLAGRVNNQIGKLGHKNPRLNARTRPQVQCLRRCQKLIDPVQHIEIYNSRRGQSPFFAQPCEF